MECWVASMGWFLVGIGVALGVSSLLPKGWRPRGI